MNAKGVCVVVNEPRKEEDIYNLQVGLGESTVTHEQKHFFDMLGISSWKTC